MKQWDLERKADYETFRKLFRDGMINEQALRMTHSLIRPADVWLGWVSRMLLFYGSGLVLAGTVYFFAYNWANMGKFLKFGIIEAGIGVCIAGVYVMGMERLSGKVLLLAASVLTGVLLAVFGQIYQTGADAYELFTGWAMLIACWVLISDFAALWMVWLIIVNMAAILFWSQVGKPVHLMRFDVFCLGLAFLDGTALVLREFGNRKGLEWLSGIWHRWVLLASALIVLSLPVISLIVDSDCRDISIGFPGLWFLCAACVYNHYRFKSPDMVCLALVFTNICVLVLTWIGHSIFDHESYLLRNYHEITFLIFGACILGVVGCSAVILKITAEKMEERAKVEI